jgi:N6-adenosine-specific RNA methylase IME4
MSEDAPSPRRSIVTDLQEAARQGHRWGTIYADPPWRYDNQATRSATRHHYDTLSIEELCALPVKDIAAPNAHLHLWVTNAFLFDSAKLFEAWGFQFKSSFVWVKDEMGIGNYWRNAHELLLTGVRGKAKSFADHKLISWMSCSRGRHSEKPEQVHGFIKRASPGPHLELFARRQVPGWDAWGNDIVSDLFSEAAE